MISQLVTYPASPEAGPACPLCGHARRIIIDALTGTTQTVCDECPRRAELARRQQAFDSAAIARVASMFALTVEQLREKLEPPQLKLKNRCAVCEVPCRQKYCAVHAIASNRPILCTGCGSEIPKRARFRLTRICRSCLSPDSPAAESSPRVRVSQSVAGRRWGYCLVCEVALAYVRGRGRPPCYCDAHRPAYLKRQNADRAAASLARVG